MSAAAARRQAKDRAALIAAYREGLGLVGLGVLRGPAATRIVTTGENSDAVAGADAAATLWWCRRAADAERVAAAATARLRRLESRDPAALLPPAAGVADSPGETSAAIALAAKRLHVALHSDAEVAADAERIIARVNDEIETLQHAGQLKSINRSYRAYRTEAAARGEKAVPYADWFNKYKADLVRQIAAALRYV